MQIQFVAGALFFAFLTSIIAVYKGRNPISWFVFGGALAIVAIPVLLVLKRTDVDKRNYTPYLIGMIACGATAIYIEANISKFMTAKDITCDTMVTDVVAMTENNPVKVLTLSSLVEKSRSDTEIICNGSALISTGERVDAEIKATKENDQWFVFYKPI